MLTDETAKEEGNAPEVFDIAELVAKNIRT
jgi:hypothetical protein